MTLWLCLSFPLPAACCAVPGDNRPCEGGLQFWEGGSGCLGMDPQCGGQQEGVWGCSEHGGLYRGLWGMLGLQVGTGVSWGCTEEIWGILSMGLNGGNWGWTGGEGLPWGYMEILWVSWGTQAPRGCTGGSRGTPWGWVP